MRGEKEMNTILQIFLIIALIIFSGLFSFCKAEQEDTTKVQIDTLSTLPHYEYYIVVTGGFGMTTGAQYTWDNDFHNGPAFGSGLEIPLFFAHRFGIQIYPNYWISKKKDNGIHPIEEKYIKVSDNYLSGYSTLWRLKLYIGNKKSTIRLSLDFGWYSHETNEDFQGVESGLTMYLNISEHYFLSLSKIINWRIPSVDYNRSDFTGPNMIMLNFGYKLWLLKN